MYRTDLEHAITTLEHVPVAISLMKDLSRAHRHEVATAHQSAYATEHQDGVVAASSLGQRYQAGSADRVRFRAPRHFATAAVDQAELDSVLGRVASDSFGETALADSEVARARSAALGADVASKLVTQELKARLEARAARSEAVDATRAGSASATSTTTATATTGGNAFASEAAAENEKPADANATAELALALQRKRNAIQNSSAASASPASGSPLKKSRLSLAVDTEGPKDHEEDPHVVVLADGTRRARACDRCDCKQFAQNVFRKTLCQCQHPHPAPERQEPAANSNEPASAASIVAVAP